jgi:hypothetical protein
MVSPRLKCAGRAWLLVYCVGTLAFSSSNHLRTISWSAEDDVFVACLITRKRRQSGVTSYVRPE